jgi:hypothetical protein
MYTIHKRNDPSKKKLVISYDGEKVERRNGGDSCG